MPEGPEIRRAADRIAAVLEATPLLEAEFTYPRLADWGPRFSGHQVTRVQARGKAMLLHIDSGHVVYSHTQRSGKWVTLKTHTLPKTKRSLRLRLLTERGAALRDSASDIDVWDAERSDEHPNLARLGPHVLDEATDTRRISAVLARALSRAARSAASSSTSAASPASATTCAARSSSRRACTHRRDRRTSTPQHAAASAAR